MAKILVFAEPHGSTVKSVTFEILGKRQGRILEVATIGNLGSSALQDLAGMVLRECMPLKVKILKNIAPKLTLKHSKILFPKEITIMFLLEQPRQAKTFPRLAGLFNAGMASDVVNFLFEGDKWFGTRPLFAGKCLAKVELQDQNHILLQFAPMPWVYRLHQSRLPQHLANSHDVPSIRAVIKEIVKGASEN